MVTHSVSGNPLADTPARPARRASAPPQRGTARLARLAVPLIAAALAAACGGGSSGAGTGNSVTVTASLGVVLNADVSVTCAPTGVVLGTASTGSTGTVNVPTSGECAGPLLVSVNARGDGSSTYFDEATLSALVFPAGHSVRAVAPAFAASMSLAVTALTEIATRQALANAGSLAALSAAQVNAANAAVVAQVLGAGVTLDVLSAPTLWSAATAAGSLGTGAADRHAYYLASLARMGQGNAAPALAVLTALAADLADGTLDGSTSGFLYTALNLATQLTTAMNAMATYASPALQGALGVVPPAALAVSSFAPGSGATDTLVTLTGTGFDTDPFHMQVKFSNNLTAEVMSSSATSVVVKVPAGAVNGPIVVTNTLTGQSVTTTASFTVTGGGGGGGNTGAWVSRASPSGFLLNGLAFGAGRFVAVGFNRTILTSTDGLSWTAATAPDTNFFEAKSVAWTGSQFVMVGDKVFGSSTPALIATSPDGVTWTRRNWTPGVCCDVGALVRVATGGGKLTVAGGSTLASSADGGLTWSVDTQPAGVFPNITGLAGNASTRVAMGVQSGVPKILVDTGTGWQEAGAVADFAPADVTWTGTQFVAVGGSLPGFGTDVVVVTSPDGATWTRRALGAGEALPGVALQAVLAVGNTLYATGSTGSISGSQHMIVQSTDGGATWSIAYQGQATGVQLQLVGMAASASRIVTVGGAKSVTLP